MTSHEQSVIRGHDNRTLRFVRSLRLRSHRDAERAFVVEGVRAVDDALLLGATPRVILVREHSSWTPPYDERSAFVRIVSAAMFDAVSDTVSPQGLLAVFPQPVLDADDRSDPLYLILDRLRDPGNLGSLLRLAAGAGADAVYLTAESVDPFNPKVVRAAMGAHFRVPIRRLDDEAAASIARRCPLRVLADSEAASRYDELDWRRGVALIIGSEAHGVSDAVAALATVTASIPLLNGVESLNAGVAGSVVLFEAARRRRAG
ncbi:MAG: TrmH family RNA methyltransferase [Thermomicrobiales bacterium]